jgi:hypothetical protein
MLFRGLPVRFEAVQPTSYRAAPRRTNLDGVSQTATGVA